MSKHNQDRTKYLGSSDMPAVMGLDPFRTPLDVFYDKTGRSTPKSPNDKMLRGTMLEPYLVHAAAAELGEEIEAADVREFSAERDYLSAQVDVLFRSGAGGEIKTASTEDYWGAGPPVSYQVQAQHQYIVTPKRPRVFVIGAIGDDALNATLAAINAVIAKTGDNALAVEVTKDIWKGHLKVYEQPPNKEQQQNMIAAADDIWISHILADVPPPPANTDDMLKMWQDGDAGTLIADDDVIDWLRLYNETQAQLGVLEKAKKQMREDMKGRLVSAGYAKVVHPVTREALMSAHKIKEKPVSYMMPEYFDIRLTNAGKEVK